MKFSNSFFVFFFENKLKVDVNTITGVLASIQVILYMYHKSMYFGFNHLDALLMAFLQNCWAINTRKAREGGGRCGEMEFMGRDFMWIDCFVLFV